MACTISGPQRNSKEEGILMDEELYRTYRKEEEFVERFRSSAWTASRLLEGDWSMIPAVTDQAKIKAPVMRNWSGAVIPT
jgi:hypothetical protein